MEVVGFYGHNPHAKYCEFSNFFESPYRFELPSFALREGEFPASVECHFSEQAIMLTKAALMGDRKTFDKIAAARDPFACKALGRKVSPFKSELWDLHLEEVAFEAVRQKFEQCPKLREVLLETGDKVLAEATRNDQIWGIGIDRGDVRVQNPERWLGRNVLGEALMRARACLRGEPFVGGGRG